MTSVHNSNFTGLLDSIGAPVRWYTSPSAQCRPRTPPRTPPQEKHVFPSGPNPFNAPQKRPRQNLLLRRGDLSPPKKTIVPAAPPAVTIGSCRPIRTERDATHEASSLGRGPSGRGESPPPPPPLLRGTGRRQLRRNSPPKTPRHAMCQEAEGYFLQWIQD